VAPEYDYTATVTNGVQTGDIVAGLTGNAF